MANAMSERGGETTRLGSFEIIRRLARGGMAEIFLARTVGPSGFEKLVVLKKILPKYADKPSFVRLFLDEARLAASLDHPHVAQVYDIGMSDGSYFFTMEYLHGQDVRSILHRTWRSGELFPLEHAVQIARHVASALHFAHDKQGPDGALLGIVHRDVSPSNMIVTYDGATKLLDFGVAKTTARSVKTRTGALKGKIAYMSPEQARGAPIDRRSDIFSLGIVLWEMVTTQRLYRGENDLATLQLIITQPPRSPSEVRPDVPPELERIVLRALAQNPDDRYATAEQLVLDLDELAREHKLKQSSNALAATMNQLFAAELGAWREARAAGVPLAEHLHDAGDMTTPVSESDFIEFELASIDDDEDDDELELEDEPGDPDPRVSSADAPAARSRAASQGAGPGASQELARAAGQGRAASHSRPPSQGRGRAPSESFSGAPSTGIPREGSQGIPGASGVGREGSQGVARERSQGIPREPAVARESAVPRDAGNARDGSQGIPQEPGIPREGSQRQPLPGVAREPSQPLPRAASQGLTRTPPLGVAQPPGERAAGTRPPLPGLPLVSAHVIARTPPQPSPVAPPPQTGETITTFAYAAPSIHDEPTRAVDQSAQFDEATQAVDQPPHTEPAEPPAHAPEPAHLGAPSVDVDDELTLHAATVLEMGDALDDVPESEAPTPSDALTAMVPPIAPYAAMPPAAPYAPPPWHPGTPPTGAPLPVSDRIHRSWQTIDLPAFDPETFARHRRIVLRVTGGILVFILLLAIVAGRC